MSVYLIMLKKYRESGQRHYASHNMPQQPEAEGKLANIITQINNTYQLFAQHLISQVNEKLLHKRLAIRINVEMSQRGSAAAITGTEQENETSEASPKNETKAQYYKRLDFYLIRSTLFLDAQMAYRMLGWAYGEPSWKENIFGFASGEDGAKDNQVVGSSIFSMIWVIMHELTHILNLHIQVHDEIRDRLVEMMRAAERDPIRNYHDYLPPAFMPPINRTAIEQKDIMPSVYTSLVRKIEKCQMNKWYSGYMSDKTPASLIARALIEHEVNIAASLFLLPIIIIVNEVLAKLSSNDRLVREQLVDRFRALTEFLKEYNTEATKNVAVNARLYELVYDLVLKVVDSAFKEYSVRQSIDNLYKNSESYKHILGAYKVITGVGESFYPDAYLGLWALCETLLGRGIKKDTAIRQEAKISLGQELIARVLANDVAYVIYKNYAMPDNTDRAAIYNAFSAYVNPSAKEPINPFIAPIISNAQKPTLLHQIIDTLLIDFDGFVNYHKDWHTGLQSEMDVIKSTIEACDSLLDKYISLLRLMKSQSSIRTTHSGEEEKQMHNTISEIEHIVKNKIPQLLDEARKVAFTVAMQSPAARQELIALASIRRVKPRVSYKSYEVTRQQLIEAIASILHSSIKTIPSSSIQTALPHESIMQAATQYVDNSELSSSRTSSVRALIAAQIIKTAESSKNIDLAFKLQSVLDQMSNKSVFVSPYLEGNGLLAPLINYANYITRYDEVVGEALSLYRKSIHNIFRVEGKEGGAYQYKKLGSQALFKDINLVDLYTRFIDSIKIESSGTKSREALVGYSFLKYLYFVNFTNSTLLANFFSNFMHSVGYVTKSLFEPDSSGTECPTGTRRRRRTYAKSSDICLADQSLRGMSKPHVLYVSPFFKWDCVQDSIEQDQTAPSCPCEEDEEQDDSDFDELTGEKPNIEGPGMPGGEDGDKEGQDMPQGGEDGEGPVIPGGDGDEEEPDRPEGEGPVIPGGDGGEEEPDRPEGEGPVIPGGGGKSDKERKKPSKSKGKGGKPIDETSEEGDTESDEESDQPGGVGKEGKSKTQGGKGQSGKQSDSQAYGEIERIVDEALEKEMLKEVFGDKWREMHEKTTTAKYGREDVNKGIPQPQGDPPKTFEDHQIGSQLITEALEEIGPGGRGGSSENRIIIFQRFIAHSIRSCINVLYQLLLQRLAESCFRVRISDQQEDVSWSDELSRKDITEAPFPSNPAAVSLILTSTGAFNPVVRGISRRPQHTATIIADYMSIDVSGSLHHVIKEALDASYELEEAGHHFLVSQKVSKLLQLAYDLYNSSDLDTKQAISNFIELLEQVKAVGSMPAELFEQIKHVAYTKFHELVNSVATVASDQDLDRAMRSLLYMAVYTSPRDFLVRRGNEAKNIVSVMHDAEPPILRKLAQSDVSSMPPCSITSVYEQAEESMTQALYPSLTETLSQIPEDTEEYLTFLNDFKTQAQVLSGGNDPASAVGAYWAETLLKDVMLSALMNLANGLETADSIIAFNVYHLSDLIYKEDGHIRGFVEALLSANPAQLRTLLKLALRGNAHRVLNRERLSQEAIDAILQAEITTGYVPERGYTIIIKGPNEEYAYYYSFDFRDFVVFVMEGTSEQHYAHYKVETSSRSLAAFSSIKVPSALASTAYHLLPRKVTFISVTPKAINTILGLFGATMVAIANQQNLFEGQLLVELSGEKFAEAVSTFTKLTDNDNYRQIALNILRRHTKVLSHAFHPRVEGIAPNPSLNYGILLDYISREDPDLHKALTQDGEDADSLQVVRQWIMRDLLAGKNEAYTEVQHQNTLRPHITSSGPEGEGLIIPTL